MLLGQAIQRGDAIAFRTFYEKTYGPVLAFARKHARDEEIAADLVQTAYLKVWEKRQTIRPEFLAYKSYLFTTVRNLVIKEYKRLLAEQETLHLFQDQLTTPTNEARHQALYEQVQEAVATLPPKQRRVFELVKFEGLTYKEAARELDIAESTIEKHIIRALRSLREMLSDLAMLLLL